MLVENNYVRYRHEMLKVYITHIHIHYIHTHILHTYTYITYIHICVASLQKGPHVAKIKNLRFFLILIEQVMTNLLKKN